MRVREAYNYSENQVEFQEGTGTETAILRHLSNGDNWGVTVVLDLKQAYKFIPLDRMLDETMARLDYNTTNMIKMALQPTKISKKQDTTGTVGRVALGVAQGYPLSPILFNIYMDNLEESLQRRVPRRLSDQSRERTWNITPFAYDVKAQAEHE